MKTREKTVYVADDGEEFDSQSECAAHEVDSKLTEFFRTVRDTEDAVKAMKRHWYSIASIMQEWNDTKKMISENTK